MTSLSDKDLLRRVINNLSLPSLYGGTAHSLTTHQTSDAKFNLEIKGVTSTRVMSRFNQQKCKLS